MHPNKMNDNTKQKNSQNSDKQTEKSEPLFQRYSVLIYLRDLSIVIIGVLITLSITDAINSYNQQEEIKGMLKLVKQELEDNRKNLEFVQDRWDGEQRILLYLSENMKDVKKIPTDTLDRYSYSLGAIYSFTTKNDSYDVLKNSTIKQYIKEKDLLPKLSKVYRGLSDLNGQLEIYSNKKSDSHNSMMENMDANDVELFLNGNPYYRFDYALKEKKFRNFLLVGRTILSPGLFEYCKRNLDQAIEDIEKYGY